MKDKPAAIVIVCATPIVAWTINGEIQFGNKWLNIIFPFPQLMDTAASTYSLSRSFIICARSIRAIPEILLTDNAIIVLKNPGPNTAEITIIKSIPGIACITSRILIKILSMAPPKNPAIAPITIPIVAEIITAIIPIEIE